MPKPLAQPYWVGWNQVLADQLNLPIEPDEQLLQVMSGRALFQGHDPIAQKYAGHQFGGWNPELGDGRGLLLGEWVDEQQNSWEFHLKGAGKTPYSRFGDGRAVLRSSIREFLGSEALHGLNIPTTRALALIGSSEQVYRETVEPGAALLRVSSSHIRFGHFEWFAFSNQTEQLSTLVDFVIRHHYPDCTSKNDPVVALFSAVVERTAKMIAGWMAYGFVHGVMNTDNMSILGETFDYGPYAFLDTTKMNAVFNHTDAGGRYAFDQQPAVGLWNLQRLGQALGVLVNPRDLAEVLVEYHDVYQNQFQSIMNRRLGGLNDAPLPSDAINEWVALLATEQKDYHLVFRTLSKLPLADWTQLRNDFIDRDRFDAWLNSVKASVIQEDAQRQQQMVAVNPATVARTHHLQSVIDAAHKGDFSVFESLFSALQSPFEERKDWQQWHLAPADPEHAISLSCSS
jgi:uncharacterized protein YdiU (UPF0061 family)